MVPVPPQAAQGAGDRLAEGHQGGGLLAGAQEQAARHRARVLDEVGPSHEGAHGVAQQEVGQAGETAVHPVVEALHVPDQVVPAVPGAEIAVLGPVPGGAAVAQVVVARHGEAVVGEEPGKGVIPAHILGNAVDQLDQGPGGPVLGEPPEAVDLVDAVAGGEGKFLPQGHSGHAPFMVE